MPIAVLDPSWERKLNEMRLWQTNFRVTGASYFKNTPTGATISLAPQSAQRQKAASSSTPLKGQYQFTNYMMISQNQPGWDFQQAHSLI